MKAENFVETLRKNVDDTVRFFQESTKAVFDAQAKQIEFASNFFNLDNMQKNFESMSAYSKDTFKSAIPKEFSVIPKELMDTAMNAFGKQSENIIAFNQKYLDALSKQINTSKSWFDSSFIEKLNKDFESGAAYSRESFQAVIDNYKKVANPSFEVNKKFYSDLNEQLNAAFQANFKLWSELINVYNSKGTETAANSNNSNFRSNNNSADRKAQVVKETIEN
jgi:hypothetical protein